MATKRIFLSIAIQTPLRRLFDYLPNENINCKIFKPGIRVSVSFGKQKNVTGIIVAINNKTSHPKHKLKRINSIIDNSPIINNEHLNLLIWASNYYHHPIGEVIFNALPSLLRKNNSISNYEDSFWSLTKDSVLLNSHSNKISQTQTKIVNYLRKNKVSISQFELNEIFPGVKRSLYALEKIGLVQKKTKRKLGKIYNHKQKNRQTK